MHYLTQYYKNRCNKLQEQINSLNGKLYILAEAAVASSSSTETADQSGGFGNTRPFSGANLGQLLGSGNMNAVNNYLSQYYANNPSALRAIAATQSGGGGEASGSAGSGAGAFDGANLGRLLGNNDTSGARRYVNQFGGEGGEQNAPAMRSMLRAATNKAAGVRGGSIGGGEMAGGYGGGALPYGEAGGAADSGAFGGGSNGGGGGGFSGEVLGQLLGRGDMGAVANYLAQFKGNAGSFAAPKRRRG